MAPFKTWTKPLYRRVEITMKEKRLPLGSALQSGANMLKLILVEVGLTRSRVGGDIGPSLVGRSHFIASCLHFLTFTCEILRFRKVLHNMSNWCENHLELIGDTPISISFRSLKSTWRKYSSFKKSHFSRCCHLNGGVKTQSLWWPVTMKLYDKSHTEINSRWGFKSSQVLGILSFEVLLI